MPVLPLVASTTVWPVARVFVDVNKNKTTTTKKTVTIFVVSQTKRTWFQHATTLCAKTMYKDNVQKHTDNQKNPVIFTMFKIKTTEKKNNKKKPKPASSIMANARRSLTLLAGLKNSHLTNIDTCLGAMRLSLTIWSNVSCEIFLMLQDKKKLYNVPVCVQQVS